jgi:hypothetical protein
MPFLVRRVSFVANDSRPPFRTLVVAPAGGKEVAACEFKTPRGLEYSTVGPPLYRASHGRTCVGSATSGESRDRPSCATQSCAQHGVSVIADLAAHISLVKGRPKDQMACPASRNAIRLDRRARAVQRQHAADDGVRGFMTGDMSAALGHWYPAKSEKLTQAKGQVHAGQRWRCTWLDAALQRAR